MTLTTEVPPRPKRSFQAAHDAVAAGGEIVALDTAGYGPVMITKSVSVIVPPGISGFVTVPSVQGGATGITIAAGASDTVTLQGLIIEGPSNRGGLYGIYATQVGHLVIEDTIVRNFSDGIRLNSSVRSDLFVRRGAIRNVDQGISAEAGVATGIHVFAHVLDTELTDTGTTLAASGNGNSTTYLFVTRCAVTGSSGFVFYASGRATIIADSCSVINSSTVFFSFDSATTYARNNSIAAYTTYGSPGTFSGQIQ